MTANFFKGVAAVVTAVFWIACMVGLVMVDQGRLAVYPWQIISGVLGMFAAFATLVIAFAHAVITTAKQ